MNICLTIILASNLPDNQPEYGENLQNAFDIRIILDGDIAADEDHLRRSLRDQFDLVIEAAKGGMMDDEE